MGERGDAVNVNVNNVLAMSRVVPVRPHVNTDVYNLFACVPCLGFCNPV